MKLNYVNERFIEAVPENPKESKALLNYPAFFRDGIRHFAANKPLVAQNLHRRLKAKFGRVLVDSRLEESIFKTLKLKALPEWFKYHTSPKKHQDIALRFLYTTGSAGLLLDPGMGKTKVYLDFVHLMQCKRALVVCPKALLFTWEDEVAFHRPELSIYTVKTTDWEAEKPGILAAQLVVINYDKAVRLCEGLKTIHFDSMNIDEGLVKDPKTNRTTALTDLSRDIKYKVLNSGTLINNSPLDMFAPVRYLEPTLVGNSFSNFKGVYAVEVDKKIGDNKKIKMVVNVRNVPEMRDTLESCCIVMTKDEWLELPSKTFKTIRVPTSEEQKRVYTDLQSNYASRIGDKVVEVASALVLSAKQMQVANGFVYYVEGGGVTSQELDGFTMDVFFGKDDKAKPKAKREVLFFDGQPKADHLVDLLKGQLVNRRVMVWYNLQAERQVIEEYLTKAGINFMTIAGGEKDTGNKVRTFNKSKDYTVLLCQAKAVNYGVTVLGHKDDIDPEEVFSTVEGSVYTQIFYSLNFSLEVFLQQQDRIHRIGQDKACEYYVLLSDLDIESYVYGVLESKREVKDSMMVDFVNSRKVTVV